MAKDFESEASLKATLSAAAKAMADMSLEESEGILYADLAERLESEAVEAVRATLEAQGFIKGSKLA